VELNGVTSIKADKADSSVFIKQGPQAHEFGCGTLANKDLKEKDGAS